MVRLRQNPPDDGTDNLSLGNKRRGGRRGASNLGESCLLVVVGFGGDDITCANGGAAQLVLCCSHRLCVVYSVVQLNRRSSLRGS